MSEINLAEVIALRDTTVASIKAYKQNVRVALEPSIELLKTCEAYIASQHEQLGAEAVLARKFTLDDNIEELSVGTNEDVTTLTASKKACETFVHAHLGAKGLQNMKLQNGQMAFFQKGSSCSIFDWDATIDDILGAATAPDGVPEEQWAQYLAYIKARGNFQILKRDVNKTAVKEIVEAKGQPPAGIKYDTYQTVQFRRGSGK